MACLYFACIEPATAWEKTNNCEKRTRMIDLRLFEISAQKNCATALGVGLGSPHRRKGVRQKAPPIRGRGEESASGGSSRATAQRRNGAPAPPGGRRARDLDRSHRREREEGRGSASARRARGPEGLLAGMSGWPPFLLCQSRLSQRTPPPPPKRGCFGTAGKPHQNIDSISVCVCLYAVVSSRSYILTPLPSTCCLGVLHGYGS